MQLSYPQVQCSQRSVVEVGMPPETDFDIVVVVVAANWLGWAAASSTVGLEGAGIF